MITHHNPSKGKVMSTNQTQLTPLDQEHRVNITTAEAAAHLNRAQQTLRIWACRENGPIRPIRINSRLAWPVADLKRLLGVAA
jgi:hypothetical protein